MARRPVRSGDFEATFTLSRRGSSSESERRMARRPSLIVWTMVAVLTGWILMIVFSAVSTGENATRWLISLPFVAVLVIASIGALAIDRYFRRRELQRAVNAELRSLAELELRAVDSKTRLAERNGRISPSGTQGTADKTST